MILIDRLTGEKIEREDLIGSTPIIPQRYSISENYLLKSNYPLNKGDILFNDGSLSSCIENEIDETLNLSISLIVETFQERTEYNEVKFFPPNHLIPQKIFDDSANLRKVEEILHEVLDAGHLHQIANKPRVDMKYDEEIMVTSRVKRVANTAHRYLASHSETWQQRTLIGIYPKKLLALVSEDHFSIYENKVFVRLLDKLRIFLTQRLLLLKKQRDNLDTALDMENTPSLYYKLRHELCTLWGENLSFDETRSILSKLKNTIQSNENMLERIKGLQSFGLYLLIPPALRQIPDHLHKTNILAHDQHYRHIGLLWTELHVQRQRLPTAYEKLEQLQLFQENYNQYVLLLLLHAFQKLKFEVKKTASNHYQCIRGIQCISISLSPDTSNWNIICEKNFNHELTVVGISSRLTEDLINHMGNCIAVYLYNSDDIENEIYTKQCIWGSPYNFEAIEQLIILLVKWLYKPSLVQYGKKVNDRKIPTIISESMINSMALDLNGNDVILYEELPNSELEVLKNICTQANAKDLYQVICYRNYDVQLLQSCPLCGIRLAQNFEARRTNRTFICSCSDCSIAYGMKAIEDSKTRSFFLEPLDDKNMVQLGRWKLEEIIN